MEAHVEQQSISEKSLQNTLGAEAEEPVKEERLLEKNEFSPMVSVVVPVKNGAEHVKELLDSLMKLDYDRDKLEVIIVDGNSTDGTRNIAAQYPVKLVLEERPGLNAARNTGIKHSRGQIVALTDVDCIVPEDWLRNIVEDFHDSQVGCVGGSVSGYYNSFLSLYADESFLPVLRSFKERQVLSRVKPPQQYPVGCNMAVSQDALRKAGVFDERVKYGFDEDELVERICESGYKMVLDPEVLVKHKHRPTLSELLRQNFNYGRGVGPLLRAKGLKTAFARWILLSIMGCLVWGSLILSLVLYALFVHSLVSQIMLLASILLPSLGLMMFYACQTIKKEDRKYLRIIAYPLIDIARLLVFVSGGTYQLLNH
jgi:glycosyltransferase involved in cell wall biosynthesis